MLAQHAGPAVAQCVLRALGLYLLYQIGLRLTDQEYTKSREEKLRF